MSLRFVLIASTCSLLGGLSLSATSAATVETGDDLPVERVALAAQDALATERVALVAQDALATNRVGIELADPNEGQLLIGVTTAPLREDLAYHLGVKPDTACIISSVLAGMPAERAGLHRWDVLTHLDGETPASAARLRELILQKNPGETIRLHIRRGGNAKVLEIAPVHLPHDLDLTQHQAAIANLNASLQNHDQARNLTAMGHLVLPHVHEGDMAKARLKYAEALLHANQTAQQARERGMLELHHDKLIEKLHDHLSSHAGAHTKEVIAEMLHSQTAQLTDRLAAARRAEALGQYEQAINLLEKSQKLPEIEIKAIGGGRVAVVPKNVDGTERVQLSTGHLHLKGLDQTAHHHEHAAHIAELDARLDRLEKMLEHLIHLLEKR